MSAKDTDTREWSDPKDYGLPFVEITPIKVQSNSTKDKSEVTKEAPVSTKKKVEKLSKEPISNTDNQPTADAPKAKEKPVIKIQEKPKSNTWVWLVILFATALLVVIIWQLQKSDKEAVQEEISTQQPEEKSGEQSLVTDSESTLSDQTSSTVNQDSITAINNSNPNLSKPAETGTTIANTVKGNLIRIDSKAEKVRYFIVAASLPNEQLALEIAENFAGKSPERYLIYPYEASPNYRVAIGKFDTWKAAADEVARIKSQYSEDLWILNY